MKKFLSILFATMLAVQAWAYDFQSGDLCYNITSSAEPYTARVTYQYQYSSNNYSGRSIVTIPEKVIYNEIEYSVTSIGYDAFSNCSGLTSVTIPNSVTSIGYNAFYNCNGLTSVTIPNSVISIGEGAFGGCSSLTEVTIPNSVISIGEGAFGRCIGLTKITLPFTGNSRHSAWDTNQYPFGYIFGTNSYTGGTQTIQEYYGKSTSSTTSTQYYIPTSLKEVVITGCSYIPYGAFYKCGNLTSITIGNSVTNIGGSAFYNCSGLTSVTINNSVTSIGDGSFSGCSGLTSITIPNSVTSIGDGAFSGCSSLTSITLPFVGDRPHLSDDNTNQYPLGYIFGTNSYTGGTSTKQQFASSNNKMATINYYIPASLKEVIITGSSYIQQGAFYNCKGLTSITIPNTVTSIGRDAFYNCKGLTKAEFTSVESLLGISFGNESANPLSCALLLYIDDEEITELEIPESVTSIGNYAFYYYKGLTSVTIPESVTSIGNRAFYNCSGLTSVIIGNSVTEIGYCAFYNCSGLTSVTIPNSVTTIGNNAFDNCSGLTSVTIPNSVTSIGGSAFCGCSGLTSVTIPNSVTSIAGSAFYNCSGLTSVTIPNSVTSIDYNAFKGCSSLTSVTIPNSVTRISNDAFFRVKNIVYSGSAEGSPWGALNVNGIVDGDFVYSDDSKTKLTAYIGVGGDVNIPEFVTSIGNYAFDGCIGLTSITISNSVTSIGDYAFSDCSGLTLVSIPNSVTMIGYGVFRRCSGLQSLELSFGYTSYGRNDFGDLFACSNSHIPSSLKSVILKNGVTSISSDAFKDCNSLTSITIPSTVTSIGSDAFSGCDSIETLIYNTNAIGTHFKGKKSLKNLIIGNDVTTIGKSAFDGCASIISVTIPHSVKSIEDDAFKGCSNLTITCEVESKPKGWSETWNPDNRPVIWAEPKLEENQGGNENQGENEQSNENQGGNENQGENEQGNENQGGNEGENNEGNENQGGENTNPGTAVAETAANAINIYAHGNTIVVENVADEICIYDAMGRMIARRDAARHVSTTEIRVNGTGLYIVKVGDVAKRVMIND